MAPRFKPEKCVNGLMNDSVYRDAEKKRLKNNFQKNLNLRVMTMIPMFIKLNTTQIHSITVGMK